MDALRAFLVLQSPVGLVPWVHSAFQLHHPSEDVTLHTKTCTATTSPFLSLVSLLVMGNGQIFLARAGTGNAR